MSAPTSKDCVDAARRFILSGRAGKQEELLFALTTARNPENLLPAVALGLRVL